MKELNIVEAIVKAGIKALDEIKEETLKIESKKKITVLVHYKELQKYPLVFGGNIYRWKGRSKVVKIEKYTDLDELFEYILEIKTLKDES